MDDPVLHRPALRLRNHDVHRQPLISPRPAACCAHRATQAASGTDAYEDQDTWLGRGRRLAAMELQLRELPPGALRNGRRAAAHAIVDCGE
ncbi:protein of unknown function [Burkholderia multivorans]